jgi:hypothetical protein
VKLDWYGDALQRAVNDKLVDGLDKAGVRVRDEMTLLIGVEGPPRSLPGRPPHIDTGNLIGSIDFITDSVQLEVMIGTTVDYAMDLEEGTATMSPRPFLVRALVQAGEDAARRILS